tara:strand:+ start:207 stop:452 length:246 start_codon:yes stop_codon:yes gene_type:complete
MKERKQIYIYPKTIVICVQFPISVCKTLSINLKCKLFIKYWSLGQSIQIAYTAMRTAETIETAASESFLALPKMKPRLPEF